MREKGFSLIEVAVAVIILALILTGVTGIFWQGFAQAKKAQDDTIAMNLARERIETLSNASSLPTDGVIVEDYGSISGFPAFKRRTLVIDAGAVNGELKQIFVTVYWDADARSQTYPTMQTNY
jgi:prepilin-type N-terminal cleavage/methylation domain-containing protein